MRKLFCIFLLCFSITISFFLIKTKKEHNCEYELTLENNNTVIIEELSSKNTYIVPFDSLEETLLKINL